MTTIPRPAPSPLARLGWALADAWTIALRDLQHWRLQPGPVLVGWLFSVMLVLMFGGLFGGAIAVPDNGRYFDFLMPGMFAMNMLFGLETTMLAVSTDAARGITDRFRAMPLSGAAVVLGRCLADMLNALVGLGILLVAGWLLGWRWHGGLPAALAAIGLLLWLRFSLLWVGIYFGLIAKGSEVTAVQILVWPVGFLSSVFVDPATMTAWLGALAQWNPLSATAAAARALFLNPGWQGAGWPTENALLLAVLWPLLITAIFFPLAVRRYRHLSR